MNICVKRTEEPIRSCNSCFARNYTSDISGQSVDTLYDIRIGSMVNCVCKDCLKKLIAEATSILAE